MPPSNSQRPGIFLAMPRGSVNGVIAAARAFERAKGRREHFDVHLGESQGGCTHNNLWCEALNARAAHGLSLYGMMHTDVVPLRDDWLETLVTILYDYDADLISVVMPQDSLGLTQCGLLTLDEVPRWDLPADEGQAFAQSPRIVRPFLLQEIHQLPETFSLADLTDDPGIALVAGLGLSLCRLDRPWCDTAQLGCAMRIYRGVSTGVYVSRFESEDLYLSEHIHRAGGKIVVTRAVPVGHYHMVELRNDEPFGAWAPESESIFSTTVIQ